MTKAFAYLRVSGKSQVEGDGFARQLVAIKEYARRNDIRIVGTYREEGVSGETCLEDRPALMEMLDTLAENGTKLVLIEKLDRLARDLMVQETIIGDLRKRGYDLISAMEPDLLQRDPTRVLMRQIFGAIAQYDKAMIVAKMRAARARIRATGVRCEGRKPYGRDEQERAVMARMRELRATGLGFDKIAAALNAEGLKPRDGERWWGRSINNTLRHS